MPPSGWRRLQGLAWNVVASMTNLWWWRRSEIWALGSGVRGSGTTGTVRHRPLRTRTVFIIYCLWYSTPKANYTIRVCWLIYKVNQLKYLRYEKNIIIIKIFLNLLILLLSIWYMIHKVNQLKIIPLKHYYYNLNIFRFIIIIINIIYWIHTTVVFWLIYKENHPKCIRKTLILLTYF